MTQKERIEAALKVIENISDSIELNKQIDIIREAIDKLSTPITLECEKNI